MIHFEVSEFDSPDKKGSGTKMHQAFLDKLDKARGSSGIAFKINSGYRTPKHNKKVGGKEKSSHLLGRAADIHVEDSRSRWLILKALLEVGFNRIGVGSNFIHVDDDPSKDKNVIWVY